MPWLALLPGTPHPSPATIQQNRNWYGQSNIYPAGPAGRTARRSLWPAAWDASDIESNRLAGSSGFDCLVYREVNFRKTPICRGEYRVHRQYAATVGGSRPNANRAP